MRHQLFDDFEDDTFVCAECGCGMCISSTISYDNDKCLRKMSQLIRRMHRGHYI